MNLHHKNRHQLLESLNDGLILLQSAPEALRNGDVHYEYRQDSDFLYLTGITAPNHILLIDPKEKQSHLFIPDINTHYRIWMGHQLQASEAKKKYQVDQVHYVSEFAEVIKNLNKKHHALHYHPLAKDLLKKAPKKLAKQTKPLRLALNELRIFKSAIEIDFMRKANQISLNGHIAAMKSVKSGIYEYQLEAMLEKEFRLQGAFHNAYPSIVATGNNAAILHYHDNNTVCKSGDLVLIDAGCEWQGYASDVTRTFPVEGKFSAKQKEIYQIVLSTQKQCINMIRPGISMLDVHIKSCHVLSQGLIDLGILKIKTSEEALDKKLIQYFYPHGIGHLLGLDVHDVGGVDPKAKKPKSKNGIKIRTSRQLQPGFVVTVEPGLYFIDAYLDDKKLRKERAKEIDWQLADTYRSVGGIRIEDDVLVTKTGFENLTIVPKEIEEIEILMK